MRCQGCAPADHGGPSCETELWDTGREKWEQQGGSAGTYIARIAALMTLTQRHWYYSEQGGMVLTLRKQTVYGVYLIFSHWSRVGAADEEFRSFIPLQLAALLLIVGRELYQ